MDEKTFHRAADAYLSALFEQLEAQDGGGILDIELTSGILTIEAEDARVFVVSKHGPSQEIWLSSPLSGGLHFRPAEQGKAWALPDGRRLSAVLSEELSQATGATFDIRA